MGDVGRRDILRRLCRERRSAAGKRGGNFRELEGDIGSEAEDGANGHGADDELATRRRIAPYLSTKPWTVVSIRPTSATTSTCRMTKFATCRVQAEPKGRVASNSSSAMKSGAERNDDREADLGIKHDANCRNPLTAVKTSRMPAMSAGAISVRPD